MAGFEVDADLVRALAQLLEENGLTEIEYETRGRRIRVARNLASVLAPGVEVAAAPGEAPTAEAAINAEDPGAVLAPVVGTVYVAPEPGAPPFVRVGDAVTKGQTLLIIEAMKTMNPVPAPRPGRVKQILVTDGSPAEYGEVLMILE